MKTLKGTFALLLTLGTVALGAVTAQAEETTPRTETMSVITSPINKLKANLSIKEVESSKLNLEDLRKLGACYDDVDEIKEVWNTIHPDEAVERVNIYSSLTTTSLKRSVFGADGRTKVSNINVTPYKQILYVQSYYVNVGSSELDVYRGSAGVLANGKILTAGHNFYSHDRSMNKEAAGVVFYWGMHTENGVGTVSGYSPCTAVAVPGEYINTGDALYDFAVARTSDNIFAYTGGLAMAIPGASQTVKIAGYPADKGLDQYEMSGVATLSSGILQYTIDTYGGQSGTPIVNGSNQVIGVHTFGYVGGGYNGGCGLTQTYLNYINNVI